MFWNFSLQAHFESSHLIFIFSDHIWRFYSFVVSLSLVPWCFSLEPCAVVAFHVRLLPPLSVEDMSSTDRSQWVIWPSYFGPCLCSLLLWASSFTMSLVQVLPLTEVFSIHSSSLKRGIWQQLATSEFKPQNVEVYWIWVSFESFLFLSQYFGVHWACWSMSSLLHLDCNS